MLLIITQLTACKPALYTPRPSTTTLPYLLQVLPEPLPLQAQTTTRQHHASHPLDISKQLNQTLSKKSTRYLQNNSVQGYTLQLYKGFVRQEAEKIQQAIKELGYKATMRYKQPHYLVKSGFFTNFLHAHARAYAIQQAPSKVINKAIILPATSTISHYIE